MDETDAEFLHLVRLGDRRAAGRLIERYLRACRAVAPAVTGVEADADDACQDPFVVAIECSATTRSAGASGRPERGY